MFGKLGAWINRAREQSTKFFNFLNRLALRGSVWNDLSGFSLPA